MNRIAKCIGLIVCSALLTSRQSAANEGDAGSAWEIPSSETNRERLNAWMTSKEIDDAVQARVWAAWDESEGGEEEDVLTQWMRSVAIADPRVAELMAFCEALPTIGLLPEFGWLDDESTPRVVRDNAKLYLGRRLVQSSYFDESLIWLGELKPSDAVDPASLLFYRAVAYCRLVRIEEGQRDLERLLARESEIPTRYQQLAELMRLDLAGVEADSFNHIARRMQDIERRLHKARTGEKVIEVENGVIESLDKKIKELEEEEKKRQQQRQMQPGGGQGSTPMEDSRPAQLKGEGRVDRKDVGSKSGWGDMPDKDREKALQQISRDFPAHYREVIEQYFRTLATDDAAADNK